MAGAVTGDDAGNVSAVAEVVLERPSHMLLNQLLAVGPKRVLIRASQSAGNVEPPFMRVDFREAAMQFLDAGMA